MTAERRAWEIVAEYWRPGHLTVEQLRAIGAALDADPVIRAARQKRKRSTNKGRKT